MDRIFKTFPNTGKVFIAAPGQCCMTAFMYEAIIHYLKTPAKIDFILSDVDPDGARNRLYTMLANGEESNDENGEVRPAYLDALSSQLKTFKGGLTCHEIRPKSRVQGDILVIDDWYDFATCNFGRPGGSDMSSRDLTRIQRDAFEALDSMPGLVIIGVKRRIAPRLCIGGKTVYADPFTGSMIQRAAKLIMLDRIESSHPEQPHFQMSSTWGIPYFMAELGFNRKSLRLGVTHFELADQHEAAG